MNTSNTPVVFHDAQLMYDNDGGGTVHIGSTFDIIMKHADKVGGIACITKASIPGACRNNDTFNVVVYNDGSVAVYRTNHHLGTCD